MVEYIEDERTRERSTECERESVWLIDRLRTLEMGRERDRKRVTRRESEIGDRLIAFAINIATGP